ncbi:HTH-type transcriptional activator Btr [Paenibacillus sp. J2TS4]|nr:HTH-type transcriptional activator Btr [Paenibacillus sp. J2TS4]
MSDPLNTEHLCLLLDSMGYRLQSVEWLRTSELEPQLVHSHVLFVVRKGRGRLTIDYTQYGLRGDAVQFVLPGQTIGLTSESDDLLDLYVLTFDIITNSEKAEAFPLAGEVPIHPDTQIVKLCKIILHCSNSGQSLERFRGQSAFQELLYWIMKNVRLRPEDDPRTALDRSKAYIDAHYSESLTIEQLARLADISPKYYVDLFKKTYGQSAIDYITEVRLNSAKQLMAQSDLRLRDIAHQVGYSDEFYFSRKFKKEIGVAPTVYMKNRRRKIAAYTAPILGHLLALNIIPYAAPLHPKWTAYYYRTYRADIPVHLSAYRFNQDWESKLEALSHAQPEIVICSDDHLYSRERMQLNQLAKVFSVPWRERNWREQFQLIAQYLDASHEADSWLMSYDSKLKSARERLHRELQEDILLVMSIHKQNYYLWPARGMTEVLYEDLQLNSVPDFDSSSHRQRITVEQLTELDCDRIMLNVCQEPESLSQWRKLQASPIWLDLKAVRRNHVYFISSDPWREYSAYACERMVDDLLRQLTASTP